MTASVKYVTYIICKVIVHHHLEEIVKLFSPGLKVSLNSEGRMTAMALLKPNYPFVCDSCSVLPKHHDVIIQKNFDLIDDIITISCDRFV